MEAVFPPENDQIFPGGFLSNSCTGNGWKNFGQNKAFTKSSKLSGTGGFQAGLFDLGNYNK